MDELLPLLLGVEVVAALGALGIALTQWLAMKAASRQLKARLSTSEGLRQDIERLLADLSKAESEGVVAMETVLERNETELAKAVRELEGAKRAVVLKALTQPSDQRRKRFCYDLSPAANT